MAEALRQQLAKAGRQAMAIHQGRDLGAQERGTHRRKRKPASEEKQQLSERDAHGRTKKKKNESESEETKERERAKERKRRQRREVKGKDKMTESEEEREREKEKKRRERQAEKEREEEQEMAMMLALAVPDVESDPASDRASPQPAPAFEVAASAQKCPIEAEQAPLTREAELERRLKEDHDMIRRLKQELDQARAAAEAARQAAREEPEAQAVVQETAAGEVGRVDGGAAMPMEWATEVLMESDLPSITGSFAVACVVSCVVCRVSCVVCRVSCVVCRVSCVVCRVSCVVCRVSCVVCVVWSTYPAPSDTRLGESARAHLRFPLHGRPAFDPAHHRSATFLPIALFFFVVVITPRIAHPRRRQPGVRGLARTA
jgi:hypothetical protein